MNGAVLYYKHICQRGKDEVVKGDLYKGTSKAAKIEVHFEDGDSSSPLSLRQYYPKTKLMLCAGHAARSHEKQLANTQAFQRQRVKEVQREVPKKLTVQCVTAKEIISTKRDALL